MKSRRIILFAFSVIPLLVLVVGIIGTTGCMPGASKKYFQLYLPHEGTAPGIKINKTILVQTVKIESIYDDYRIVYRNSPFQLNYYSYNFWIKKPGFMIKDILMDYLIRRNIFTGVTAEFSEGEPDYVLKTTVYILEEYDNPEYWSAHVKMKYEISHFKTGESLVVHTFDRVKQLSKKNIIHLPIEISYIMREEIEVLLKQLYPVLEKK
jgi:ABC-type uncharacterized transport system auxiliary subunit